MPRCFFTELKMASNDHHLSSQPLGETLASELADLLVRGLRIAEGHRDYGGMGLCYHDGIFLYSHVYDGELLPPGEPLYQHAGVSAELRSFTDEAAFVAWLAAQTDLSLAGLELADPWLHRNQRLTRQRLESAVAHARCTPPERWHDRAW